jgi:hypothetical protein
MAFGVVKLELSAYQSPEVLDGFRWNAARGPEKATCDLGNGMAGVNSLVEIKDGQRETRVAADVFCGNGSFLDVGSHLALTEIPQV